MIRAAGIGARILLFGGYLPAEIPEPLRHGLTPTIYDRIGAEAVSAAASAPVPIYVKVDSGLGRLGVPLPEAEDLIQDIVGLPNLAIEGIYSHLPFGSLAGRDWAREKYEAFAALLARLEVRGVKPSVTQVWPVPACSRGCRMSATPCASVTCSMVCRRSPSMSHRRAVCDP
jgi:alanine racemase